MIWTRTVVPWRCYIMFGSINSTLYVVPHHSEGATFCVIVNCVWTYFLVFTSCLHRCQYICLLLWLILSDQVSSLLLLPEWIHLLWEVLGFILATVSSLPHWPLAIPNSSEQGEGKSLGVYWSSDGRTRLTYRNAEYTKHTTYIVPWVGGSNPVWLIQSYLSPAITILIRITRLAVKAFSRDVSTGWQEIARILT